MTAPSDPDTAIHAQTSTHPARDRQHGGASVIALGIGLCVLLFAMVAFFLTAAIEARHRAQIDRKSVV